MSNFCCVTSPNEENVVQIMFALMDLQQWQINCCTASFWSNSVTLTSFTFLPHTTITINHFVQGHLLPKNTLTYSTSEARVLAEVEIAEA